MQIVLMLLVLLPAVGNCSARSHPANRPTASVSSKKKVQHKTEQIADSGKTAEPNTPIEGRQEEIATGRQTLGLSDPPPLDHKPLNEFFAKLSRLNRPNPTQSVRIIHFGDSHIAADVLPSTIRRVLQSEFKDGGRGFQFIGKPWRAYRLLDATVDAGGKWETLRVKTHQKADLADGRYGLGGMAIESKRRGASVSLGTSTRTAYCTLADKAEIFYLKQPDGGAFSLIVDGRRVARVNTKSNRFKTGFKTVDLTSGPHRIELRVRGNGKVRLFGAAFEHKSGVVYDVLGINGAFFYTPLRWDTQLLKDQMNRRNPDLLITMYGANESDIRNLKKPVYLRKVRNSLNRLLKSAPNAGCLILGPTDRKMFRHPTERTTRLKLVRDVQRQVAEEKGCGYIDLYALMGGDHAMEKWQSAGLAQEDGVHFTLTGYRLLGKMVAAQLLSAFHRFQSPKKNSKPFPRTKRTPPSVTNDGGVN